jgi:hypothetical protein
MEFSAEFGLQLKELVGATHLVRRAGMIPLLKYSIDELR